MQGRAVWCCGVCDKVWGELPRLAVTQCVVLSDHLQRFLHSNVLYTSLNLKKTLITYSAILVLVNDLNSLLSIALEKKSSQD